MALQILLPAALTRGFDALTELGGQARQPKVVGPELRAVGPDVRREDLHQRQCGRGNARRDMAAIIGMVRAGLPMGRSRSSKLKLYGIVFIQVVLSGASSRVGV
jgi:hypothetical protein